MVPSSYDDLLLVSDKPTPLRPPEAFVFSSSCFFVFAMCSSVDALTLQEADKKECTAPTPRRRGSRMRCMMVEVEQWMAFMLVGILGFCSSIDANFFYGNCNYTNTLTC